MSASRVTRNGRSRAAILAALVAGALLGASGAAMAGVSDSPPTTPSSTTPVSTVTTLPTPTPAPAPKPDPAPPHAHKVAARHAATTPRTLAPAPVTVSHPSPPARTQLAVPKTASAKTATRKRVHVRHTQVPPRKTIGTRVHPAVHAAPKPASTPKPASRPAGVSTGAAVPAGAAGHDGSPWTTPATAAAFALLLLTGGLAVAVKSRRPATAVAAASVAAPAAPSPVAAAPAPIAFQPDICLITWWRSDLRSQFFASAWNSPGRYEILIADSPEFPSTPLSESPEPETFSWIYGEPPSATPDAVAAYRTLAETLAGLGWEPDGRGDLWFDTRFHRAGRTTAEAAPSKRGLSSLSTPTTSYRDEKGLADGTFVSGR